MQVTAYKLNAFTENTAGGNPAAVVLQADSLTEGQMQHIAALINFSETAFISKSDKADYKVRFFTPGAEVDLCGHATIAVFSLLNQKGIIDEGQYTQETKAGTLKINIEGNSIYMQQAIPQFFEIIEKNELAECLGIGKEDMDERLPVQAVSTGLKDILVPVKNERVLENLKPDMNKIEEISQRYGAVGLHVFALKNDCHVTAVCRNFAPLYGIPEEAATGTSNGALACYLHKYGVISAKDEALFEQGIYIDRPSCIKARLVVQDGTLKEVWVGGKAVFLGESIYRI